MNRAVGFHIICTTYGFWLPNDQRGSGSDFVRAPHLREFGPATQVTTTRSVARLPFDPVIRQLARESLYYPHVRLNDQQINAVAEGFAQELTEYGGTLYACAIMPDHFHVVAAPPRYNVRRFAGRLKGAATKALRERGIHPLSRFPLATGALPSPWARLPWVVYLWDEEALHRTIEYVRMNPLRSKMRQQRWSFVTDLARNCESST